MKLLGIDLRKAERFAGEAISTVLQLAYADPVTASACWTGDWLAV